MFFTYDCVLDIIKDVREKTEGLYAARRANPPAQKFDDGHIFDENQSVRWNREEVKKRNKAIEKEAKEFSKKLQEQQSRISFAIKQYLKDEFAFSNRIASIVFLEAYEAAHSGGHEEVLCKAQEFGSFAKKILDVYKEENT